MFGLSWADLLRVIHYSLRVLATVQIRRMWAGRIGMRQDKRREKYVCWRAVYFMFAVQLNSGDLMVKKTADKRRVQAQTSIETRSIFLLCCIAPFRGGNNQTVDTLRV